MEPLGLPRSVVRAILGVVGAIQLTDGLYALLAPRSFYDDFPLGRGWVEALPSYSEHLDRDVGGLFLATAVLLLAAAIWTDRLLVRVATASFLAFSVPHLIYHAFNLEPYDTADLIGNVIGLLVLVVPPAVVLAATFRPGARGDSP